MTEKEILLTTLLDCDRADLYVDPQPLNHDQEQQFDHMFQRRQKGEPLQYIIGHCEFMGFKFFVNTSVLIPRPETEILVEQIIAKLKKQPFQSSPVSILEFGTGSGNIAVSLAKLVSGSTVTTLDISQDALDVAQSNARLNAVDKNIQFLHTDLKEFLRNEHTLRYDVIVSNPPYIPKSELENLPVDVQQEPQLALDGGEEGLDFLRVIIAEGLPRLNEKGFLALEIGDGQRPALEVFLSQFADITFRFIKDYVQTDRILMVRRKIKVSNHPEEAIKKSKSASRDHHPWKN